MRPRSTLVAGLLMMALANLIGAQLRAAFEAWEATGAIPVEAAGLERARTSFSAYPSVAAVKALLALQFSLPLWPVAPPLENLSDDDARQLAAEIDLVWDE